ncbi:MAG: hypothetical protein IPM56_15940 [Ignavibacteriales bacterium]|nr:MAG: hypothetical protein IPM56_15940 [Ignavibacteriales bacterium]
MMNVEGRGCRMQDTGYRKEREKGMMNDEGREGNFLPQRHGEKTEMHCHFERREKSQGSERKV